MKEHQEQCQRSDIRAVVSVPSFWYVDDDGKPEDFACDGDSDCSPEAEEYTCFNCGEFFVPYKPYRARYLKTAWQAALAHCQKQKAA